MTAKEMFKKLGYKYHKDKEQILYEKRIKIDDWEEETYTIIFWFSDKTIYVDNDFEIDILQAINKQVEELGWNNKINEIIDKVNGE